MQTANPVLSNKTFDGFVGFASPENTMTVDGTVNKTGVLLVCVLATAAWTWSRSSAANPAEVMPYLVGGGIVGLVLALITTFKMSWAPSLRPVCVGRRFGAGRIVGHDRIAIPGIAMQAVAMTFGTLACMLVAYRSG